MKRINEKTIELRKGLENPIELVMYLETNNSRKLFPVLQKKAWERAVLLELVRPITFRKDSQIGIMAIGRETWPLLN